MIKQHRYRLSRFYFRNPQCRKLRRQTMISSGFLSEDIVEDILFLPSRIEYCFHYHDVQRYYISAFTKILFRFHIYKDSRESGSLGVCYDSANALLSLFLSLLVALILRYYRFYYYYLLPFILSFVFILPRSDTSAISFPSFLITARSLPR